MIRSSARGARSEQQRHAVGADGLLVTEMPLGDPSGGFVWFEVEADAEVEVLEGTWSVDVAPQRGGRAVLGMPTMDRGPFVAANLRRLASAPGLLRQVVRVVVVDQGNTPVAEDPAVVEAAETLAGILRLLRQPNLGGSGGYSRIMQEATEEQRADVVVFLDDDIEVEPASLLRSLAFGRCTTMPTIVGGQMLDLGEPATVQAAAERVVPGVFWWAAADERTSTHDHAAVPLPDAPWLHERRDADYNGWWMCQFPLDAVRRIGFVLPLFLKWDDAEYSLRAAEAGVPTVSLPSSAVWHVAFRTKDDSVEWQAFFHARNRVVVAMLHGGSAARVAGHSLALDVKQLLAKQYPAARLRHAGIRAALAGPRALERRDALARARAIAVGRARAAAAAGDHRSRCPNGARSSVRAERRSARPLGAGDGGTAAADRRRGPGRPRRTRGLVGAGPSRQDRRPDRGRRGRLPLRHRPAGAADGSRRGAAAAPAPRGALVADGDPLPEGGGRARLPCGLAAPLHPLTRSSR